MGSTSLVALVALAIAPALAAEPAVTNVIASQRPETKLVDITYDLAYTGNQNIEISVLISDDGGQTFKVPAETLSGAVGRSATIQPGTGLQITWNAGVDFNQRFSNNAMVRLQAGEWTAPGGGGDDPKMVTVPGGQLPAVSTLGALDVATFQIGKYEVTWGEWKEVRAEAAARGYDIGSVGAGIADDHPVHTVNWYDVVKWCNLKSEIKGLSPVYTVNGEIYKKGDFGWYGSHVVQQNLSANGYRLPTEAEWEYAARGGANGNPTTYSGSDILDDVGWWGRNSGESTRPVGGKDPNELLLHDMSGNVWEWCWDASGSYRRGRGGSWDSREHNCAVSYRDGIDPDDRWDDIGFRLARSSGN